MVIISRIKFLLIVTISLIIFLYFPNLTFQKVSAQLILSPEINALDASFNKPKIYSFVESGFNYSQQLYGKPRIPVKKVNLNLNTTPLTSLDNANQGEFTIYLNRKPSEYAFHGQLAHEIFHLLNAQLLDCYAEGLATLFAEKLLTRNNLNWSGWEEYFQQGFEPFYGLSYFMMKEVSDTAGETNMSRLLEFVVYNNSMKKWMHINISEWLSSMSDNVKIEVEEVINKHITQVQQVTESNNQMYSCLEPS
ncbi:hypothetical protein Tery_1302 [Trichodesmium erythraeum IMS101]|uniref:Peptidase MA-like domain-containing protein n=1 Tax=Trichodesmium erythraeum (strain IMS101) TaxID=203124 RepID=Q116E4_TRIEI|nr:hypothetical protein [Trichodesmium erythraeum GBRTRLIN201]MCH2047988.1 hypothetical protein [Trichodesmium sp. ALOHA_ZT_67]MDE5094551.1 hypothetical protein [Trichodesmium sp. St11_bin5]MDT9339699.1 hypothetical protein [Trichodesmium erythraeum 21-75]